MKRAVVAAKDADNEPLSLVPVLYFGELTFGGLKVAIVVVGSNHECVRARLFVFGLADLKFVR